MILPIFSKISPIWLSLTISGGVTAIEFADDAEHDVLVVEAALHRLVAALADAIGL